jgi:hypothetical protein
MRLRPANIRLINRRKSYLDRYPLYLWKAKNHETQHQNQHRRINKGIDSSLHIRNFMHENRETSQTPAARSGSRSAGEGSGRTTRMHVYEESHSGIVPMNHSNKDGRLSAENAEGRPLIKENASQPNTYSTQSGKGVSHGWVSVRTSCLLGRYLSEIRTGCANERSSGSVRGAPGNRCPYRDQQLTCPLVNSLLRGRHIANK